jgi:hypothetical protein
MALLIGGLTLVARQVMEMGLFRGPDQMFGDQYLKTTVALLELHHVRYGSYPSALTDLKYVGNWDRMALNSVRYCPRADRLAYYVEVTRGWIGKPVLNLPAEFWTGTGYREDVAKECP